MKININKKFNLEKYIMDVPNFPKEGIIFKDITPILKNPIAFEYVIDCFESLINELDPDVILGVESRGFIFASALALRVKKPFVLARKPNKLPREVISESYELEYGNATMQIHQFDIKQNQKVLIIDDIIATGGTISAIEKIINKLGAISVGVCALITLEFLNPNKLIKSEIYSIINI